MTNEEAIRRILDHKRVHSLNEPRAVLINEALDLAVKALEKRPQGEWIYGEDECGQDGWFCSKCNFFVPWYYQYYEKDIDFIRDYKVCPHCLAEMVTYTGKDRDTKGVKNGRNKS